MTQDIATVGPSVPRAEPHASFAADVRAGLSQQGQKTLPSKYLYDALGSALFEAITQLPEYGLWRAERALFTTHAEEIARQADAANVIELGSGSATKTIDLLKAQLQRRPISYWAVDLSPAALSMTQRGLDGLDGLQVRGIKDTYLAGLKVAADERAPDRRTMVLFLGSSLGNFNHVSSLRFLQGIRAAIRPGDVLLLGADLEKPEDQLLAAYDDALGVTAAFDMNLLVRMNRDLGANFELSRFRHRSRFNAKTRDVEMHLESLCEQDVVFSGMDFFASFRAGETIHTESSHKYTLEELEQLTSQCGFRATAHWIEQKLQFASCLYTAV